MISTDLFRQEIRSRLDVAAARGCCSLIIDAKELYYALCKSPVFNPWMVFCCNAMRAEMTGADNLIFELRKRHVANRKLQTAAKFAL